MTIEKLTQQVAKLEDSLNKVLENNKGTIEEVKTALYPYQDVIAEAFKLTSGVVSLVAAYYFQQNMFNPGWVDDGFYHQIRSGLIDQTIAGGIIGLSVPFLLMGVKRVLCCNQNSRDMRIFQGCTLAFASLSISALGISLSTRAFNKIEMAIQLHESTQKIIAQTTTSGIGSRFVTGLIRYFWG